MIELSVVMPCYEEADNLKILLPKILEALNGIFSEPDMDSDGSHNTADIAKLYSSIKSDGAGIVIGSRYMKGGETDNPFILRFMSKTLNVCYRIAFGLNVYDVSDSFRIYDGEKLRSIKLVCGNFDIVEEILIRFRKKYPASKMTEIPITFSKRLYGESKRDLVRFIFPYLGTMYRLKRLQHKEETD